MLKTSNDLLVAWLERSIVEDLFFRFETGNEIVFNLSAATVSAVFMYFAFVKIPELQKRHRVKAHLLKTYDQFKEECIGVFVGLANNAESGEVVNDLMNFNHFKEYFKASNGRGGDRWSTVANEMNDAAWQRLSVEVEILYNEFQYVMTVTDVHDAELYSFFKRLSVQLYKWRLWQNDYEGQKNAMRFFWEVLAGWSFIDGYSAIDKVRKKLSTM